VYISFKLASSKQPADIAEWLLPAPGALQTMQRRLCWYQMQQLLHRLAGVVKYGTFGSYMVLLVSMLVMVWLGDVVVPCMVP
jgi:hypothetical protein